MFGGRAVIDALAGDDREGKDSAGRHPESAAGPGNESTARKVELAGGCEWEGSFAYGFASEPGRD